MPPEAGFPSKLTRGLACHRCGASASSPEAHVCGACGLPFEESAPPSRDHVFLAHRLVAVPLAMLGLGIGVVVGAPLLLDGPLFQAPEAIVSVRAIGWVVVALGAVLSVMGKPLFGER